MDLIGASVMIADSLGMGTVTNVYGFYSINLPAGTYRVVYSHGGESTEQTVDLSADTRVNINLKQQTVLQEVVITGERRTRTSPAPRWALSPSASNRWNPFPVLSAKQISSKPCSSFPGGAEQERATRFYVRGGGPDQNLILLDEAVVYNTGHLFGFFSVFNGDAIKNTTLVKGGMPAQYGGRLSSVVDVQMKDGNNQQFHAQGGIGLIASRLTLEGPIVKEKSSFMVSARRTYIDALITPFIKGTDFEGNAYYFYDVNAKANYRFSDKDRLFLSGYFGRDVFNYRSPDDDFNVEVFPWEMPPVPCDGITCSATECSWTCRPF